jgi:hypothetical protein
MKKNYVIKMEVNIIKMCTLVKNQEMSLILQYLQANMLAHRKVI